LEQTFDSVPREVR